MAQILSVNLGRSEPNREKGGGIRTGIDKRPTPYPVELRAPGDRATGLGSGLVGDVVGDQRYHGGDDQAVYAFAREDLDRWAAELGREIPDGLFAENLTTTGIDPNEALVGEVWRVGKTVELTVTAPRIPCASFAARMGEPGWVKRFTAAGRPGAYLRITRPGMVQAGDAIEVVERPAHGVTIGMLFRALTTDRPQLARVAEASPYLIEPVRAKVEAFSPAAAAAAAPASGRGGSAP